MWIVYQGIYGRGLENKKTYLCETEEDLSKVYKRFEEDALRFGEDLEEKVLKIHNTEYLLRNFTIEKMKKEFPGIERLLKELMKNSDKRKLHKIG